MSLLGAVDDVLTTLPIPPVTFLLTLGVTVVAVSFLATVLVAFLAVAVGAADAVVDVLVGTAEVSPVTAEEVDVVDSSAEVLVVAEPTLFFEPPPPQAATTRPIATRAANLARIPTR